MWVILRYKFGVVRVYLVFLMVLFAFAFIGCKATKCTVIKVETAKLSEDQVSFYTQALPRWFFHTSTQNEDKEYKSTGSWFTFFEDSTFIVTDKLNGDYKLSTQLKDVGKFVEAGQYKFINDSILEINYNDGNISPIFYLDYDPMLGKSLYVTFNGSEGFNTAYKLMTASWKLINQGDFLNSEFANIKENSCDTVNYFRTVKPFFTFAVDSMAREEILLQMLFPIYEVVSIKKLEEEGILVPNSLPECIRISDWYQYEFILNIKDIGHNYLDVVDVRDNRDNVINKINVSTGDSLSRWFTHHLRFKRKGDSLVLLNHDGSESKQVIKMYFPNKK